MGNKQKSLFALKMRLFTEASRVQMVANLTQK